MTLRHLKWLAIVAPLAFLAALYVLIHTVLHSIHDFPGNLILLAWAAAGVALFSFSVFAAIGRLERHVWEQNRALEQRNRELEALLAVGRAASASLVLPEVLAKAVETILEVTSAEAAEVWLRDEEEEDELVLAFHGGAEPEAFAQRTRLRLGEGLPGLVAERGEPIAVHDLLGDERFVRPQVKTAGFHTYCALPLRHRGGTVGVLGVAAKDPAKLCAPEELRLLEGIAERLASAVENARLHRRVLDGAVLEERVRIARELHDGLAQVLGYINTQTLAVRRLVDSRRWEEAGRQLVAMESAARRVYTDVREAILGLRSATEGDGGLVPSLRRYLEDYSRMAGVQAELMVEGPVEEAQLPPSTEIQLARIVQEALSNVRKHARAERATVRLALRDDHLLVEVADDGRGFDPDASAPTGWPRFGLQTMRERASAVGGRFEIASAPGRGTTVSVEVPLPVEAAVAHFAG